MIDGWFVLNGRRLDPRRLMHRLRKIGGTVGPSTSREGVALCGTKNSMSTGWDPAPCDGESLSPCGRCLSAAEKRKSPRRLLAILLAVSAFALPGCGLLGPSLESRRALYLEQNPDVAPYKARKMLAGSAVPGMTVEEVELSLGRSLSLFRRDEDGFEVYRCGSRFFLFFRAGQLEHWTEYR